MLKSSQSVMTIEVWIKDLQSSTSQRQVITENSADSKTQIIQVMLMDSANSDGVNVRSIRVMPYVSQQTSKNLTLRMGTATQTYGHWMHLSIVSNSTSLTINMYNMTSQTTDSISSDQIVFYASTAELNTSLGSSINGQNKFSGFLREYRLWTTARSNSEISAYRFATIIYPQSLIGYFKLNAGLSQWQQYDHFTPKTMNETSINNSSIAWREEKDLVICRQGQFYNGQCCSMVNLSAIDFRINYSATMNFITLSIVNTSAINSMLFDSIYSNFSVTALGNDFNATQSRTLRQLFTMSMTKDDLVVSSLLVNPLFYNITIQARIYSIFDTQARTIERTLVFQCPGFYLTLNNDEMVKDDPYVVTNSSDASIQVSLNQIQNSTMCFNPATNSSQNINITRIVWNHTLTNPRFINMWNVSSNNYSISQKSVTNTNTRNRVGVRVFYSNSQFVDTYLNLTYIRLSILNPNFTSSTFLRNFVENQNIVVDLSYSYTTNVNYSALEYDVSCPRELFTSTAAYNKHCVIDSTGVFRLSTTSDMPLKIVYNKKYQFSFTIQVSGTSIIREYTANITMFRDGSLSQSSCPTVIYNADGYLFDKVLNFTYEIYPDPYLYCSSTGLFYEVQKVTWSTIDQNSSKPLIGIVNTTNSSVLSAYMYNSNLNIQNVPGGSVLILRANFIHWTMNQTGYTRPTKQANFSQSTQVTFLKNPLIANITLHTFNRTVLNPRAVKFLEPNITLNGSFSQDPDNKTAVLNYVWTCPSPISAANCLALQTGTRNNSLMISIIQRLQWGMDFNKNYTFTLRISARDNPYKEAQTLQYNLNFAYPTSDEVAYDMRNTSCEYLQVYGSDIQRTLSGMQYIEYDRYTWQDKKFIFNSQIDNGKNLAKSTCGGGNVTDQYLLYFLFDGQVSDDSNMVTIFIENQIPIRKNITDTLSLKQFSVPDVIKNQYYKTSLFLFTKRQGSNRIFLNIQSVYLIRRFANLVAQLTDSQKEIDYYENLIIDASISYDSENSSNTNFTYVWTCPNDIDKCKRTTGPILNITYQDRVNNKIDYSWTPYAYSVQIKSLPDRLSEPASVGLTITKRDDYSDCIFVSLSQNQRSYTSDFENDNKTIYLDYNQSANIVLSMSVSRICDNVNLRTPLWSNFDPAGSVFWVVDQKDNNTISISNKEIQKIKVGVLNTLVYKQQLSMGFDTQQLYYYSTYLNLFIVQPSLVPIVTGQRLYVYGVDAKISLDASNSYDPLNKTFTCIWDCPAFLGGPGCRKSCVFSYSFYDFFLKINATIRGVGAYMEQTHEFNLTIYSSDGVRISNSTQGVYVSLGRNRPFNLTNIQNCSVKLYGSQTVDPVIYKTNVYYIGCDNNDDLTSVLLDTKQYQNVWNVWGLTPQLDYYNANGQLFIRPYALGKISGEKFRLSVNITALAGAKRMLNADDTYYEFESDISRNLQQDSSSTANNTSSDVDQDSNDDDFDPIPDASLVNANVRKVTNDTRISAYFNYKRNILTLGKAYLTFGNQTAYTSSMSFDFDGFSTSSRSTILFQLRAYQDLYNASQLIIPLKPFYQDTVRQFYTNITLPMFSQLYLDFFDINLNYVGSFDMQTNLLNNMDMGTYYFQQFDRIIYTLCAKTNDNYGSSVAAKKQFDIDIKRLLEFAEMLTLGAVYGNNQVALNNYAQSILAYLRINVKTQLNNFNISGEQSEVRQRLIIEKRVIYIFYNLIVKNSGIQQSVLRVLDVLTTCTQDYELLIQSGEDQELLRRVVLYIQSSLNVVLVKTGTINNPTYYDRISNISDTVYETDVKNTASTTQKITTFTSDSLSRTIYRIGSLNQQFSVQSTINTNETVNFQSEQNLFNLNVATVTVQYGADTNSSSAVSSVINVNAFDSNNSLVDVSWMRQNDSYFQLQFQVKANVNQLYQSTLDKPKMQYRFSCVFLNTTSNRWSTNGVLVESFNPSTSMISCRSYHMSQFSVQYALIDVSTNNTVPPPVVPPPLPNNTNNSKPTNNNQSQQNNNTKPPIKGDDPQTLYAPRTETYYEANFSYYIIAVIIPLVCVAAFIGLSLCFKYSGKYDNRLEGKPIQSLCVMTWGVYKIYHPLLSAIFSLKNGTLALPKIYQIVTLMIYIFSIVFSIVIDIVDVQDQVDYSAKKVIIYALIYWVFYIICRPIINYFRYSWYFNDKFTTMRELDGEEGRQKSYQTEEQLDLKGHKEPQGKNHSQQRMTGNQGPNSNNFQNDFDQFEGGDNESDEDDDDDGSDSPSQSNANSGSVEDEDFDQNSQTAYQQRNQMQFKFGNFGNNPTEPHDSQRSDRSPESVEQLDDVDENEPVTLKQIQPEIEKQRNSTNQNVLGDRQGQIMITGLPESSSKPKPAERATKEVLALSAQSSAGGSDVNEIQNSNKRRGMVGKLGENPASMNKMKRYGMNQTGDEESSVMSGEGADINAEVALEPRASHLSIGKSSKKQKSPEKDKKNSPKIQSVRSPQSGENDNMKPQSPANNLYHIPQKQVRHVKRYKVDEEGFETTLIIENKHNFKGKRLVLLLGLITILIVELIITFVVMRKLKEFGSLAQWIYAILGVIGFFLIVYDLLTGFIFAIIFRNSKANSKVMAFLGALLVGNYSHYARKSLMLELKEA